MLATVEELDAPGLGKALQAFGVKITHIVTSFYV